MNKKQIENKAKEFVRLLRLYQMDMMSADMVKNSLHCLFTDISLDLPSLKAEKINFKKFIDEIAEGTQDGG